MISDEICPPDSSLLVNMFSHLRHFTLLPSSLDANTSASFSAERRLIRHRPAITRYLPGSMAAVSYQQMSDCVGIIVRPGEKHTLLSSKLGVPHLPLSIPITAAQQPPSCTVSIVIGLIQAVCAQCVHCREVRGMGNIQSRTQLLYFTLIYCEQ